MARSVPKDPAARRRRNKKPPAAFSSEPGAPAPDLEPPAGGSWSAQTVKWWQTWVESPQSKTFLGTDWQRLVMLAPVVEKYFATGDVVLLREIRLEESLFGATLVDRLKLGQAAKVPAGKVLPDQLAARRERRASGK